MTADRIAIVGSSIWPTPADVVAYVEALEPDAVVVTDDRAIVGGLASEAATRRGLRAVVVAPNRQRDGDAAPFRQSDAIVAEASRLVAFAAKDPTTKQMSEGTALRIRLAERRGIPIEVIETPVSGSVCSLITRLRHRYEGIRFAPTPGHGAFRVKSAGALLAELMAEGHRMRLWLEDAYAEIEDEPLSSPTRDVHETTWIKRLRAYEIVLGVVSEAENVLASAPPYAPTSHRKSLRLAAPMELVACP